MTKHRRFERLREQTFNIMPVMVLLATMLIILKLTGQIAWSWFWVLFPLWLPLVPFTLALCLMGFFVVGMFLMAICVLIASAFDR